MNRSIEEPSKLLKFTFTPFFGKSALWHAFFWLFLGAGLLFLNIEVCLLKPSSLSKVLSVFIPIGVFLIIRYKALGLVTSTSVLVFFYFLFPKSVSAGGPIWQMALLCATALDFFIIFLTREEVFTFFGAIYSKSLSLEQEMEKKERSFLLEKASNETERKELEKEIQKLKEEAEQRKIERGLIERKLELIESEIKMLNGQKEQILLDIFEAKKKSNEAERSMQSFESKNQEFLLASRQLEAKVLESERELKEKKEKLATLEMENKEILQKSGKFTSEIAALTERAEQLKNTLTLSQKNLLDSENKKKELEIELKVKNESLNAQEIVTSTLKKELEEKAKSLNLLKEEVCGLQEKILHLQSQSSASQDQASEKLHKQLRNQFADKTRVLNETRKELFHTQTRLLAFEKEKGEEVFGPLENFPYIEGEISLLLEHVQELEDEITHLEQLISRVLLP